MSFVLVHLTNDDDDIGTCELYNYIFGRGRGLWAEFTCELDIFLSLSLPVPFSLDISLSQSPTLPVPYIVFTGIVSSIKIIP